MIAIACILLIVCVFEIDQKSPWHVTIACTVLALAALATLIIERHGEWFING